MQQTLRQSEDGFRSVAENAPEGILVTQGFEGPYLFANRHASEISGYSVGELLQIGPARLVPPDEYPRIKQRIESGLIRESAEDAFETTFLRKDGRGVPIEVAGSRVIWHNLPALLILFKDISRYKLLEAELERRVKERTAEWEATARMLELKQGELTARKQELDCINKELVRTNTALSVLARNIDRRRDELEKRITLIVSAKLLPVVDELRADRLPLKTQSKLDMLRALLRDLTGDGSKGHDVIVALSSTELRVAIMIKNGFDSEQIARVLHTSPHTIKTHRRNIRKKLKLQNAEVNLACYLRSKFGKEVLPLPDPFRQ